MGIENLIDKAKEKSSQVASSIKDKTQSAIETGKEKSSQIASTGKEVSQTALEVGKEKSTQAAAVVKEVTQNVLEIGMEKLNKGVDSALNQTEELLEILHKCGFIIGDLSMTITVPPEITIQLEDSGIGQEALLKLLEDEKESLSLYQSAFIQSMLKTYELVKITGKYGYTFGEFELCVSIPPGVTVNLKSDKEKKQILSTREIRS